MNGNRKWLFWGVLVALMAALALPIAAQDDMGGMGGVIVEGNWGGDPNTFNGTLANDSVSSLVINRIDIDFIAIDPETETPAPGGRGGMAASWEYDETGTVLTVHLRDDIFWSDGTPVTSADYVYSTDSIRSGETPSTRASMFLESGGSIQTIEAPDDKTVVITLGVDSDEDGVLEANCAALISDVIQGFTGVLPAHAWQEAIGEDFALMADHEYNQAPPVSAGAFVFSEFRPGEQVTMVANQDFSDALLGYVNPSAWVLQTVADADTEVDRFLAGDFAIVSPPAARNQELRDNPDLQIFETTATGVTMLMFNLADPTNPQNGLDEDGNHIDQGVHPLFGDLRVRQAIAMATDKDAIIEGVLQGEGIPAHANTFPRSWAYPDGLEGYSYDPEAALALLNEAGWDDLDGDGILEATADNESVPAEENDGDYEFRFRLATNAGNPAREQIGQITVDQLGEIGIIVEFEAIDFGTLVGEITGQEFDAIIVGAGNGLEPDGSLNAWYGPGADIVGSGLNAVSFYTPRFRELLTAGRTVAGCDQGARAAIYGEAYEILARDLPWLTYYNAVVVVAANANVEGWDPFAYDARWNMDAWNIITAES